MYKTILFDFDGTVFDTGEGIMKSVQYAAEAFGYHEPDWHALREFVGPPLTDTFAKRYNVDEETAKAMTAKYRERYRVNGLRRVQRISRRAGARCRSLRPTAPM